MKQAVGPEQWESPWGAGPWRWGRNQSEPPRGARWFPIVLSLLIQLGITAWAVANARSRGELLAAGGAIVGSFLLLGLRRWPGPTVVAVAVATMPSIFVTSLPLPIALPLAFAVIGATVRGARAWVWGVVGASLVLTAALAFTVAERPIEVVRPLIVTLVLSVLVGVGETARNRRDRFAEYRAAAVRRRQSEAERERVRIARELHDVLAHSLSSINVQAGVGLHLIDDQPDKAAEALANIKQTSKSALEEVRGVLGFLRSTTEGSDGAETRVPQPDLAGLPALINSMAPLGLNVTLTGEPPVGMAQLAELAIYRVVQEALTNITRHSQAKSASVSFVYEGDALVVSILDDGAADSGPEVIVEGRGLLGMQERAALLGGTLSAGWAPEGGFRVQLRLPLGAGEKP